MTADSGALAGPLGSSPLDKVSAQRAERGGWTVGVALVVHACVFAAAAALPPSPPQRPAPRAEVTRMVHIEMEQPEPEPEAVPEPEPEPEPPPPPPPPPPKRARAKRPRPARPEPPPPPPKPEPEPEPATEPPPEAAQAAEVLTKSTDSPLPAKAQDIVSGSAERPVGGFTAAEGTGAAPVRDANASAYGVKGGKGKKPVDRSRPPRLAGGSVWDCDWPEDGDLVDEDEPVVAMRVRVNGAGEVEKVTIIRDPGFGFGAEARRCALRKPWVPALDRDGQPIGQVALVEVRFSPPY